MKITGKKTAAAAAALTIALTGAQITAAAEQKVVTEYDDLWSQSVEVKAGETVKWYVNVPEGTEPKGCKATIKIPGLGWGTDTHNKEEGHLKLEQGENFVYEFTPEEEGDILYTCWMGSSCHKGYIHVTAAETEQLISDEQPVEITDEQTETDGQTLTSQQQDTTEQTEDVNANNETEADADSVSKEQQENDDTIDPEEEVQADDEDEAKPQEKEQLSETKAASETASQTSSQTTSNPTAGKEDGSKLFAAAVIAAATALIASKKRRSR